jgi:thioester reductase-like protein
MRAPGRVFLTGATGFLGRYLLRDLLLAGHEVAVLARDTRSADMAERIGELLAFWSDTLRTRLAAPVVLSGDLRSPGLGLSAADRHWLGRHCQAVIHAAARVCFRPSEGGEPWHTNVTGTRHLLALAAELGLTELHHVSTAYVCGRRTGPIDEDELECGQDFHNEYEQSKYEAERCVRRASSLQATVYRPSIVVGDSQTGYTSTYHGFYRFLDFADRLAGPGGAPGRRTLPLRLPFGRDEPRNLVPVDWVSQAVMRILAQPRLHGRTYHLVAREPTPVRAIQEAGERVLGIAGVELTGSEEPADPTPAERLFREHLGEYWPYRHGDPTFADRNTRMALPDLPAPPVDRAMLGRLIAFARARRWGRIPPAGPGATCATVEVNCARYLEDFFPAAARRSTLAELPLDVAVVLDVRGPEGGVWSCRWVGGELEVQRGWQGIAEVVYRLDVPTFADLVLGELPAQEAFFERRVEVEGDVEKGLKLAVLFGQFVQECPYPRPAREEATDGRALPV